NKPRILPAYNTLLKEAYVALDLSVLVDDAYTETAALADWVLPAAAQYEKWRRRSSVSSGRTTSSSSVLRSSTRCRARCPNPRSTPASCAPWASFHPTTCSPSCAISPPATAAP